MAPLNLALLAVGIALIALGYRRARPNWERYQQLRAQEENIARYEAWRGGVRGEPGPTGASVAMEFAKREAGKWALVGAAGFVLVFLGFFLG